MKLLTVSFCYPPMAEPRAVQVARLFKHLDAQTVVVCADYEHEAVRHDSALVGSAETSIEACLRVPYSVSRFRRIVDGIAARSSFPLWNRTPDHLRPWKRAVLSRLDEFLRIRGFVPQVLVTFAYPLIDHLVGLELKERHGWPWLAHFSDPWVDNPFAKHDALSRVLNRRLERQVVTVADRVVFTSAETASVVMSKYPPRLREKVRVIPHSYEPELFNDSLGNSSDESLTIRYLGDLYGHRTPKPLFEALVAILSANPSLLSDVKFELIGSMACDKNELWLDRLPRGLVALKPTVSYRESLSLMQSASGLLVIDAPARQSIFLPSKLVDYIGAGRPILGITPPGTAADLIKRLGGWAANPTEPEAIVGALTQFIEYLRLNRSGPLSNWGQPELHRRFQAAVVAKEFAAVLTELMPEK